MNRRAFLSLGAGATAFLGGASAFALAAGSKENFEVTRTEERRLRSGAVFLGNEVRQRHRMAELLRSAARRRRLQDRLQADLSAHGRTLRALRRPSRPCLQ